MTLAFPRNAGLVGSVSCSDFFIRLSLKKKHEIRFLFHRHLLSHPITSFEKYSLSQPLLLFASTRIAPHSTDVLRGIWPFLTGSEYGEVGGRGEKKFP